ncbi:hypothetical protein [Streptomyces buecherae]|uniref:hypothetical protein n=1 Tax=Streptomyces buecherae TaxID=2763006 RepID=UPI0036B00428
MRFTATGRELVELARTTLDAWWDGIQRGARGAAGALTVGSTRYTLGYLLTAGELARAQTPRDGVRPRAVHVRTAESLPRLRAGELDLMCGSVATVGSAPELAGFEAMEWRRSGLALLTNLPADRLPGPRARVGELPTLPLVVPSTGLIGGFLRGWFGAGFRRALTVAAEVDTIG